MQFGLAINMKRCIGCHTCSMACKLENNTPNGVWWTQVLTNDGEVGMDVAVGTFPNTTLDFRPFSCQHCTTPACETVCPTGATHKDEETGIVLVDSDVCIGCQACIEACPYQGIGNGVRTYIDGEPEYHLDVALGSAEAVQHHATTVEKCLLCYQRTSQGGVPACVETCPQRARVFGDLDDPNSEISQLIASEGYELLKEDEGTGPNVYYLK